jgi:hypothetical protein
MTSRRAIMVSKGGKKVDEKTYEGWKNYSSWNCGLWLSNDEPIYRAAVEFMKDYKGDKPYWEFCEESGLDVQRTPDLIKWVSSKLDYKALDAMMWDFAPEGSRS